MSLYVFGAFVVAAGPLIMLHFGAHHWFLRDEWSFLADRGGSRFPDLLEPNGGAHWVLVPRLFFWGLWQLFGINTYKPYQLGVVVVHLAVAILLRGVMRRTGVGPWLATCAASVIVLYGPGAQNIVWAFQVGFIGSIAFGLAHLLLADHDGPVDRRDLAGLSFGLLAITSSGIGVTTTLAVGVAALMRRGWRTALLHTGPLAALYVAWTAIADASATSPLGSPSVSVLVSWVRSSAIGTFLGLGYFPVIAWLLAVVLVAGMVLSWGPWRGHDLRTAKARLSMPTGLLVAAVFFAGTTGVGRWWLGERGARADRYMYLTAALVLPILAVAAQALAERWRTLTPALLTMFVLPIPFNLRGFSEPVFDADYMDNRRYILTTAVRMPFARDVPRDVQPVPDPYSSDAVTIGFLLTAAANGDMTPSDLPITPRVVNEFRVRLGVAQRQGSQDFPSGCRAFASPVDIEPELGRKLYIGGAIAIATQQDGVPTSPFVTFSTSGAGTELTIELPDLDLQLAPRPGAHEFVLCERG